ncbi:MULTISPECIES: PAS domain-containing protein [unclassified Lacticaseibacillus]|uniref:PAS domain-containing protein n=1 Tax=unclassified Lacticaseibacillus TaxID=2759744 RepID=UPI00194417FE|nr:MULTISPECIES: PAS domain-containing protein [unclassified Lacticaseibacillus]
MAKPEYDGAYINMETGRLSLLEVQQIFSTIPFEIDLIDHDDHFSWYSNKPNREHVRHTTELGENVQDCHPAKVWPIVKGIIDSFKDGSRDSVARPLVMHGHRVLIRYYALRDEDGNYLGTIEFTGSVESILQTYEKGGWSDASTGASKADGTTGQDADASTGASEETPAAADASTGASEETATPDASTGASEETAAQPDASTGASEETETPKADASTGASATGPVGTDPKAGPFDYDL